MNVMTVEMDAEEAKTRYKLYLEANKKQASKEYSAARRAYRALSKGYKIIDIYRAFEKTGVKPDGNPKLALVRADAKIAYFTKLPNGAGEFRHAAPKRRGNQPSADLVLPIETFSDWEMTTDTNWPSIKSKEIETNVPFIPAHITVPGKMENYFILFEVDQWKPTAKVKDPYLLQRLNDNTFVVLAEWNVSPVEAIIMRGA